MVEPVTSSSQRPIVSTGRSSTIDIAKGLAIVAIVADHVLRGLESAELIDGSSPAFVTADRLLYLVHLPVFALLGGLFIRSSIERSQTSTYLRQRDVTFLYLYVIWSLLQGSIKVLSGSVVNSPVAPLEMLELWHPDGQLWYLPFLIVGTTAIALIQPWRSSARGAATIAAAGILVVLFWGTESPIASLNGLSLHMFLCIGALIGAPTLTRFLSRLSPTMSAMALVCGAALWVGLAPFASSPTVSDPERTLASIAIGIAATCGGVVAFITAAQLLSLAKDATRWLAFVGRRSLEIFLAHIIAASASRIALHIVGIDAPAVQIAVGIVVGVSAPIAVWALCRRLGRVS